MLDAWALLYEQVTFIWVFPGTNLHTKQVGFRNLMAQYPRMSVHVLNDPASKIQGTLKKIDQIVSENDEYDLALIGLSAPFYAWRLRPVRRYWFINGIPEEREAYSTSWKLRATTKLEWFLLRRLRTPDLIITVSTRMNRYLQKIFPAASFLAIPTTVDALTYRSSRLSRKGYFTYLGSGAPWQSLDVLSAVWLQLHKKDPSIKFRVISRDYRTEILKTGIASTQIEFVESEEFEQVARYLSESEVGFFIRKDSLVNRVCFPTKMAEYLAAGCWVVTSDLDWDIADYVRKYQVGLLVDPTEDATQLAQKILKRQQEMRVDAQLPQRMETSVQQLSRAQGVQTLINKISESPNTQVRPIRQGSE